MKTIKQLSKAMRIAILPSAMILATAVFGAQFSPVKPVVDHRKKATCGIKWTINKSQSIACFAIYRNTYNDFDTALPIGEVDGTTSSLTDWGASQYQEYYYWVIPMDSKRKSNVEDGFRAYSIDATSYSCKNSRFWGKADVYLTSSVKSVNIGTWVPLYFKVNMGTSDSPMYDHVLPDRVVFTSIKNSNNNTDYSVAGVFGNFGYDYNLSSSYLNAKGSFGFFVPNKPGIVYMRAYYKSATTVEPLRIEIKKPTFEYQGPYGEVDVVDNACRDLRLKCNGKFVCPTMTRTLGDSCDVITYETLDVNYDLYDYDYLCNNAFGLLAMEYTDSPSEFELSYKGIAVKNITITPSWDSSRNVSAFIMNSSGSEVSKPNHGTKYTFGIKYGSTVIPQNVTKHIHQWITWGGLSYKEAGISSSPAILIKDYWDFDYFNDPSGYDIWNSNSSPMVLFDTPKSNLKALGEVTFSATGYHDYAILLFGRKFYGSIRVY